MRNSAVSVLTRPDTFHNIDRLPAAIKRHYTKGILTIANPNERWDAGCSGGSLIQIDSIGKNGKTYRTEEQAEPNKQLIYFTADTVNGLYNIYYYQGGFADVKTTDCFYLSKNGDTIKKKVSVY